MQIFSRLGTIFEVLYKFASNPCNFFGKPSVFTIWSISGLPSAVFRSSSVLLVWMSKVIRRFVTDLRGNFKQYALELQSNCKINSKLRLCCSVTNYLVKVSWVFIAVKNVGSQTSPSSRQANSHDWPSLLVVIFSSLIGGQLLGLQKSCV